MQQHPHQILEKQYADEHIVFDPKAQAQDHHHVPYKLARQQFNPWNHPHLSRLVRAIFQWQPVQNMPKPHKQRME